MSKLVLKGLIYREKGMYSPAQHNNTKPEWNFATHSGLSFEIRDPEIHVGDVIEFSKNSTTAINQEFSLKKSEN